MLIPWRGYLSFAVALLGCVSRFYFSALGDLPCVVRGGLDVPSLYVTGFEACGTLYVLGMVMWYQLRLAVFLYGWRAGREGVYVLVVCVFCGS